MSRASNANLHAAKRAKNDEFYTQLSDIENELKHYTAHFEGKRVLCNCDDPFESNFFKYFALNFDHLGLRELVATCYAGSPIAGTQLSLPGLSAGAQGARRPYVARVTSVRDATGDGALTMDDVAELFRTGENSIEELEGDGDFRSPECLGILDECDVVVTNPPFSLWREYLAVLEEHGKKFVIIGPSNAITYKEVFPLIKDGRVWLGCNSPAPKRFLVPEGGGEGHRNVSRDEGGRLVASFGNVMWYTNLDIPKRHEPLILTARYAGHEADYPMYDNYAAINVDKVKDIPENYMGVMGVPITFLDKYCPDQFEIVGGSANGQVPDWLKQGGYAKWNNPFIGSRKVYQRIFIRRKRQAAS